MKLVDAEIGHIDWAAYPCPRGLLAPGTRFDLSALDGHVTLIEDDPAR